MSNEVMMLSAGGGSRVRREAAAAGPRTALEKIAAALWQSFGVEFTLVDGGTGQVCRVAPESAGCDWSLRSELCREVARRNRAEFIEDDYPVLVLALPIPQAGAAPIVAVSPFITRNLQSGESLACAARALGTDERTAGQWVQRQTCWSPEALLRISELVSANVVANDRLERMEGEVDSLSLHLSTTYEEISLLYRLTQKLKISSKEDDLARLAVEWLSEVVPAESLVIQLVPTSPLSTVTLDARTEPLLITYGPQLVDCDGFTRLVEQLGLNETLRPCVTNQPFTGKVDWAFPNIMELIVVPLCEGSNVFGWLAAFNHSAGGEFGTVEASLLSSVGAILGIHSGNTDLYRQQADFLAGMVRALTSAIDAKDPYTCGHSDRVARVAMRLAEEVGLSAEEINTIYLSGLLHDVGKIGIDDNVLRKPGALTAAEYEHIKTHAEIGHRILRDIKKLDPVLPVVLHHHEQWDGKGYPHGLKGEETPLLARIVAVADAFDAMGSDRPYRQGMPEENLDAILRAGAGKQWDALVVDAFFRAREDIREIARREREVLTLDVQQWL